MLQLSPSPAPLPRAENSDFVYPDGISSNNYAGYAKTQQESLRDGTFFIARDYDNQSASVLFNTLTGTAPGQEPAVFHFFGHGGGPTGVNAERYSYLLCYNGSKLSYIVHTQKMADIIRAEHDPNRLGEIMVLDSLADGRLKNVLLVVLEGCFTANDFPETGSPAKGVVAKGAKASLGFKQTIYGVVDDPTRNWAHRWSQYFWEYVTEGHPDDGAIGFRAASEKALARVNNEIGPTLPTGLNSRAYYPDGGPDLKRYPAGGRDDR